MTNAEFHRLNTEVEKLRDFQLQQFKDTKTDSVKKVHTRLKTLEALLEREKKRRKI